MNALYLQTQRLPTTSLPAPETGTEPLWTSPFQARIAAIYLYPETGPATALLPAEARGTQLAGTGVETFTTEAEMLQKLWQLLQPLRSETLVTFNGRVFAIPFLYIRSALNQVPISNPDLLQNRYKPSQHVDLLEAFTFHHIIAKPSLLQLARLCHLPPPVLQEGDAFQSVLEQAMQTPTPAPWTALVRSGLDYARIILALGRFWNQLLRPVF